MTYVFAAFTLFWLVEVLMGSGPQENDGHLKDPSHTVHGHCKYISTAIYKHAKWWHGARDLQMMNCSNCKQVYLCYWLFISRGNDQYFEHTKLTDVLALPIIKQPHGKFFFPVLLKIHSSIHFFFYLVFVPSHPTLWPLIVVCLC